MDWLKLGATARKVNCALDLRKENSEELMGYFYRIAGRLSIAAKNYLDMVKTTYRAGLY
jgi:hypothetical protein